MRVAGLCLVIGTVGQLSACLPQTGGGGSSASQPAGSPVATASEIDRYIRNGSAFVEHFDRGERTHIECGYFAGNNNYDAITFELDYDSYSWDGTARFSAGWDIRGSRLCFIDSFYHDATSPWFMPPALTDGCYVAEWSTTDDALILISPTDEILATIITDDGPGNYQRNCDL
ncbi:MAG: hypothetical protein ACFCVH_10880 [Alphaproteobacteria bacterium]